MKRILLCLLAALLCLSLAGCAAKGDTSSVRIVRGTSETLEKEEIRAAMDAAMDAFRSTREGETLLALRYDEAYSLAWVTANDPEPDENTLVLLATYLDADGRQHSGMPWVLARNEKGNWNVEDMK
ncbi:MAG: hypothetical protein IJI27_03190 [Oscillospiraceae bacterium]|nr:hypothetical protein [Oscillospiraceae bacterium]